MVLPIGRRVIGEHYRLIRKIGDGAFGIVYEAHHAILDQRFAVKVLRPELCANPRARDRFLDEARALIRFSHRNVVELRHVGEVDDRLYIVMDFVPGISIKQYVATHGPFSEPVALNIMEQVLAGLEAAHRAGIIHRDLKPSNLYLIAKADDEFDVRILDFGLSKLGQTQSHQAMNRSVPGTVVGTLAYMSPEQLQGGRNVDHTSDIFSAGLVLMEMLQGCHPYPDDSGIVVATKFLRDPIPRIRPPFNELVSRGVQDAIGKSLARDPQARFSSAAAFSSALRTDAPRTDRGTRTTKRSSQWLALILWLLAAGLIGLAGAWAAGLLDP